ADCSSIIVGGGPGRLGLGDPASVQLARTIRECRVPVLGICYGHQFIAKMYGGSVSPSPNPEFGPVDVDVVFEDELFNGLPGRLTVWMSHNDEVTEAPPRGVVLASSASNRFEALKIIDEQVYGVQFHLEVEHTVHGKDIMGNFLRLGRR
ncbi:MAG: gamma-glutamyl-gamma-aminobutyrate hydrolase family protein, partial [Thermoprotei archaeon]